MRSCLFLILLCCALAFSVQAQDRASAAKLKAIHNEIQKACSNGSVSADDMPGVAYSEEVGAFIYFPVSFGELITVSSVKINTTEIDELLVFSFLNGVYYAYLDDNMNIHSIAFQEHFWMPPYALETSSVSIAERMPFITIVKDGKAAFPRLYMNQEGNNAIKDDVKEAKDASFE